MGDRKASSKAPVPAKGLSRNESYALGKKLRDACPREAHAGWTAPKNRPDAVDLVLQSEKGRVPDLLPLRHGRMARSAFTFYRGAALTMAADLSSTPTSGIRVQCCGDAHLSNFGGFATPGGELTGHIASRAENAGVLRQDYEKAEQAKNEQREDNQKLSQAPVPKPKGSRGAPRKHGADFQLTAIEREPDVSQEFFLGKQKVRVRVWHKLHFKRLAKVPGSVVCVEFLKEDGTPRYKRPIWLFWTGPEDVTPQDLCRMYLWRFAIEHLFRFLKQHLGLNSNRSTNLENLQRWMWLVGLAYWQLLLIRDTVQADRPAWHPHKKDGQHKPLTPAQVQRSAQAFLLQSGSPAANTRPAGKGRGRQKGYRPTPRKRFDIVFKTKKSQSQPKLC